MCALSTGDRDASEELEFRIHDAKQEMERQHEQWQRAVERQHVDARRRQQGQAVLIIRRRYGRVALVKCVSAWRQKTFQAAMAKKREVRHCLYLAFSLPLRLRHRLTLRLLLLSPAGLQLHFTCGEPRCNCKLTRSAPLRKPSRTTTRNCGR